MVHLLVPISWMDVDRSDQPQLDASRLPNATTERVPQVLPSLVAHSVHRLCTKADQLDGNPVQRA